MVTEGTRFFSESRREISLEDSSIRLELSFDHLLSSCQISRHDTQEMKMTYSSSNRTLFLLSAAPDVAVRCSVLPPLPLQESNMIGVSILSSCAALCSRLIREYSFSSEWPTMEQK